MACRGQNLKELQSLSLCLQPLHIAVVALHYWELATGDTIREEGDEPLYSKHRGCAGSLQYSYSIADGVPSMGELNWCPLDDVVGVVAPYQRLLLWWYGSRWFEVLNGRATHKSHELVDQSFTTLR